ncbi:putative spermidine/putrescine transport system substrate-binding protein [Enhydrobacter aerosaccus]|uniref:Putative spermidine/putrescine transport system substrate-binding protein n=1 Tax=Enhydrobacter aerosaccus TaxID=225324 RepID=A0A1T4SR22_9HYPH|nr:ABC transporter substrate-binding protein [Enhydrobacter aerosaccus]SKA30679.1 putative spermidine/putrescine transport system substrate-binding protein [Enhydrobacter aerosaccus]
MTRLQTFAEDQAEIMAMTRRRMLTGGTALGVAAATGLGGGSANAAPKEVVLANFGGDAVKAMTEAFAVPYEKATGGKMVVDGAGPSNGKIKTMVTAKNVIWDMVDSGLAGTGELGPAGLLEEIDYSVVDKSKVTPGFAYKYGVCNYMFSSVQAWDTTKVKEKPTLADFFDFQKYPGKRLMRKDSQAMLELALMADGVPADKLYPLDVPRALKKIAAIKKDLLFWSTGAESQTMLREGEVVMGWLWHTRGVLLQKDTNKKITFSFDGGLLQPGLWVVPKGNPAGKQAMVGIASAQAPEGQVKLLAAMGNGPANPAAAPLVPAELNAINPAAPENVKVQAKIDADWYEKNYAKARQDFLDMIAS